MWPVVRLIEIASVGCDLAWLPGIHLQGPRHNGLERNCAESGGVGKWRRTSSSTLGTPNTQRISCRQEKTKSIADCRAVFASWIGLESSSITFVTRDRDRRGARGGTIGGSILSSRWLVNLGSRTRGKPTWRHASSSTGYLDM